MTASPSDRIHGLDALRAVALTCGILLHAAAAFVLPGGAWAVGTSTPEPFPGWLIYYLHTFRLETFFLLAGFFGALVVSRRGAAAYARDRAVRILLVFLVCLYPMKYALAVVWIIGGQTTGWLELPPVISLIPSYLLAFGAFLEESWPHIGLTHLWFLYTLSSLIAVGLVVRALANRVVPHRIAAGLSGLLRRLAGSRAWPWVLACVMTPILSLMTGMDVDTPDRSFLWHLPVMLVYGVYFAIGWWLQSRRDLLPTFAARSTWWLAAGVLISLVSVLGVAARYDGGEWATANATGLRWATSFGTSLTMALTVFGWIGFFVRRVQAASARWRYFADASYWIYIVHLPVVAGLQVALAGTGLPWWIQIPLITAITLGVTLLSYRELVRDTWVGRWLNGRRARA